MRIVYSSRTRLSPELEREFGASHLALDDLLQTADFVSLHVPLTPETRHLIGADQLARMKPDAFLINTARGAIVDEPALVNALRENVIRGAGLDVYENEPLLAPGLAELRNAILLPHVGSATIETRTRMGNCAADNLLAGLRGETPPNCLNCSRLRPYTTECD
jgi:glyoxylate reductase